MKQQISEFDATTNETIQRDANKNEIEDFKARAIKIANVEVEAKAKEAAKLAILDRIGLTADELKTILG